MTRPPLKDVGASVRKRLTDTARQRDENAQLLMHRFAIERLIFRLTQSVYRDQLILKGAMLFSLWAPVPYRSTGDLDLLGQGDPTPTRMAAISKPLCDLAVQDMSPRRFRLPMMRPACRWRIDRRCTKRPPPARTRETFGSIKFQRHRRRFATANAERRKATFGAARRHR